MVDTAQRIFILTLNGTYCAICAMTSPESDIALEGFLWFIVFVTLDVDTALRRLRKLSSRKSKAAQNRLLEAGRTVILPASAH
jgi:hypothetical protein